MRQHLCLCGGILWPLRCHETPQPHAVSLKSGSTCAAPPPHAEASLPTLYLTKNLQLHSLLLLVHSTLPLGDAQLAMRLLGCAAGAQCSCTTAKAQAPGCASPKCRPCTPSHAPAAHSSTDKAQLPAAVVTLLRHHGWPAAAHTVLRGWVKRADRLSVDSGLALVQALTAGAAGAEGAD